MKTLKQSGLKSLFLAFLSLALLTNALIFNKAEAAIVVYSFSGLVDDLSDKKVDAADYGFSEGDVFSGTVTIDDAQPDLDNDTDIALYEGTNIVFSFTISSSSGVLLYSDNTLADDFELKIEDNHGSSSNPHDKFEIKDKSTRAAISTINGNAPVDFYELKLKLEDDQNADAFSSTIPTVDGSLGISNFNKKHEFEIKFKSSGDEIKLKGDIVAFASLSEISEVPIPASAWLFISSIIGLVGAKRKS
ncbi:MAG: hypothetical protein GY712_06090 [Oceanicoccus sp.]|uniref:VPLPA-CTERM sorting domain-containing protein n=1 Tax=Oceanicoccus sp. TaxID=2691044 RepID=UPI002639B437|nr:VPLPA-CTERM sorting domain-containing protein [Oceanicoccus sp.]MCP3907570.1 hypothetical protein [Oceanicoccus sp.]MDG1772382.1 VPLPA-CTERM sorting domain-containing protein [Oceanicoccus sp.]